MKHVRIRQVTVHTLLVALLVGSPLVSAQVYKWTDENGVTHYSQVPPPEDQEASIEDIPAEPENAGIGLPTDENLGNPATNPGQPSAADLRRQQIARSGDQREAEQMDIESLCARTRAQLDEIEPNRRVYYTDDKGETVRMDDQERVDQVAQLRAILDTNCP